MARRKGQITTSLHTKGLNYYFVFISSMVSHAEIYILKDAQTFTLITCTVITQLVWQIETYRLKNAKVGLTWAQSWCDCDNNRPISSLI